MKKLSLLIILLMVASNIMLAQVGINTDGTQPAPSAGLDVKFSNKGFLLPRLSHSMIQSIINPTDGLQAYCTTDGKIYIYVATAQQWKALAYDIGTISSPPFSCGNPITINHFAGDVAPVDKTVTYGTVTNIPGESSKCWITSNLGSDRQANAVNDSTEASAGWYWQFNLKQGYKLADDGITRTPNTSWISSISETSDWQSVNDPCALELGTGWRIPTSTEWANVGTFSNWMTWTGPWTSELKMHAAGYLYFSNAILFYRGSYGGFYWSSTQYNANYSWHLDFTFEQSSMVSSFKAYGFTIRCLRD